MEKELIPVVLITAIVLYSAYKLEQKVRRIKRIQSYRSLKRYDVSFICKIGPDFFNEHIQVIAKDPEHAKFVANQQFKIYDKGSFIQNVVEL